MVVLIYLQSNPVAFIATMGLTGLIVGSFINVVIHRLPKIMQREWREQCRELMYPDEKTDQKVAVYNLITPRSKCPKCDHLIRAYDNIPVISYLFLRGKCRFCKTTIPSKYPLVEIFSSISAAFIAWHFSYGYQALFATILTWGLICLAVIDLEELLLPDNITLPFLWIGLSCNFFYLFTDIRSSLIGAIAGYGILWSVYMLFKLVTGKEAMGYGDFKLLAMLGAWLGWQSLAFIIICSSLLGTAVGISLILFAHRKRGIPIPFGPYLAISGWIALIWGKDITTAYLQYFA